MDPISWTRQPPNKKISENSFALMYTCIGGFFMARGKLSLEEIKALEANPYIKEPLKN